MKKMVWVDVAGGLVENEDLNCVEAKIKSPNLKIKNCESHYACNSIKKVPRLIFYVLRFIIIYCYLYKHISVFDLK